MRAVIMSTSWLILLFTKAALIGLTSENELLASPMKRWLYSTPNDQFGVKPYSNPTPMVPPQRVAVADANSAPAIVLRMLKRLLVTAAPPFTYSRAAFRA